MDSKHFSLNRAVHLARRDLYYEQAVDLLYQPDVEREFEELVQWYSDILFLLKNAQWHAKAAVRVNGKDEKDQAFLEFIRLLIGNVKAFLGVIRQREFLYRDNSFIGVSPVIKRQLEDSRHCARNIQEGIRNLLALAGSPFRELKKSNLESMSEVDRARYTKSRQQITAKGETGHRVSFGRTHHTTMVGKQIRHG